MDAGMCALELLGIFFSVVAWFCLLGTTISPQWLTLSTDLLPTEIYELGIWETCVVQELIGIECRPYDSLLGLPSHIKLARILTCVAVVTGLFGMLLSIPGLHLVNSCQGEEEYRAKRAFKLLGGAFCVLAGVAILIPVSYMAHLTVMRFFDESVPEVVPRWEFGDALFCGWAAGFFDLVAGVLLLASCLHTPGRSRVVAARWTRASRAMDRPGKRSEYV